MITADINRAQLATMNMMTGYLAPTEGEVRVDGHSVTQDPAGAKACIGYLPEQPPLYVDMTVREYDWEDPA